MGYSAALGGGCTGGSVGVPLATVVGVDAAPGGAPGDQASTTASIDGAIVSNSVATREYLVPVLAGEHHSPATHGCAGVHAYVFAHLVCVWGLAGVMRGLYEGYAGLGGVRRGIYGD